MPLLTRYQSANKRAEPKGGVNWHLAMRPGKRKAVALNDPPQAVTDKIECVNASIRAKAEHPFQDIKK